MIKCILHDKICIILYSPQSKSWDDTACDTDFAMYLFSIFQDPTKHSSKSVNSILAVNHDPASYFVEPAITSYIYH